MMASERQILALGAQHGYGPSPRDGFVGMAKLRGDGTRQRLDIFTWGNAKVADKHGIPRAYLVLCPGIGDEEIDRWRLPLVDWPGQETRKWGDVASEFDEVLAPILDGPAEQIAERLRGLGSRYDLSFDATDWGRPLASTRPCPMTRSPSDSAGSRSRNSKRSRT